MQYTIEELRQLLFKPVYDVYEIFQDFFGAEYTDLQEVPDDIQLTDAVYACTDIVNIEPQFSLELSETSIEELKSRYNNVYFTILVRWPKVTVTNEHDKSTDIQELYARIAVDIKGTIPFEYPGFMLTRSAFTQEQWNAGYIHSHLPRRRNIPTWESPCLGRGPIRDTIASLKSDNDEIFWRLFCHELSLYVTVESLTGVPYIKLESINKGHPVDRWFVETIHIQSLGNVFNDENSESRALIRDFTQYYLQYGHLALGYSDNRFQLQMPYYDFLIDISNSFIEWFNQNFTKEEDAALSSMVLEKLNISEGKFYIYNSIIDTPDGVEGTDLCFSFKSNSVHLHIIPSNNEEEYSLVMKSDVANFILTKIIKIVNYYYANEHTGIQKQSSSSGGTATASQRNFYL